MPTIDNEKPEIGAQSCLGALSSCTCKRCMTNAANEVESGFSQETRTSNYINKLQAQIERLETENRDLVFSNRHRRYSSSSCSVVFDDDQRSIPGFSSGEPGINVPSMDEPKERSIEPKMEIKRRRKIEQKYGKYRVERDDDPESSSFGVQDRSNESVLTVTREFDKQKNFWRRQLSIVSPAFVAMLHEESPYDVDLQTADDVLSLHEPLMALFHNRKTMNRYIEKGGYASDSEETKQARAHTKLLLDFMRKELDESFVLDDIESAQPSGLIEFANIWLLYPPGTVVYTKEEGEYEAFVVDSVKGVERSHKRRSGIHTYTRLELTCWSINYDGEVFGRVWSQHEIFPFRGPKEISSLDLIPEKFLPDAEKVKSDLRARGQKFWALQGQNYREFTGQVWSGHMGEESTRVMIDRLTYQRRQNWPISINNKTGPATAVSKNWRDDKLGQHPRYPPPPPAPYDDYGRKGRPRPRGPRYNNYGDEIIQVERGNPDSDCDEDASYAGLYTHVERSRPAMRADSKWKQYDLLQPDSQPDSLALLLCPQQVHGYCFREKIWKLLNVNQLKHVNFRKNAWDRLVLDDESKDIVQAMAASYVDKSAKLDDLIAGKGAGLVALLHGPPGTGKTLTAECVAESFEKPLYQVTCGDIGTDSYQLEQKLDEIFDLATNWGAILLFDEADVFLQERDYYNLIRNAMVSGKSQWIPSMLLNVP